MMEYSFMVAGIHMRFLTPVELHIPDNFRPFQLPTNTHVHKQTPEMVLEIIIQSSMHAAGDNLGQPRKKRDPKIVWQKIFMGEEDLACFSAAGPWLNFMNIGELMLPYKRVILHASAVLYDGKAYLFVAPSGGGKSTAAEFWRRCFGSEILNGDKVILDNSGDTVMAYGSPVAGSSKIYNNSRAPVGGIFILKKFRYNHLERIHGFHRLLVLYNAAVKSPLKDDVNEDLLDELKEMTDKVPIYHYYCTNSDSAARYLHLKLFGNES